MGNTVTSTRHYLADNADHFSKLHKALGDLHDAEAERYEKAGDMAASEHHAAYATELHKSSAHLAACASAMKAAQADFEKRLVPDNVRGTTPSNAPPEAFGMRAIPRTGAPPLVDKASVPLQFQHLVEISDDL